MSPPKNTKKVLTVRRDRKDNQFPQYPMMTNFLTISRKIRPFVPIFQVLGSGLTIAFTILHFLFP